MTFLERRKEMRRDRLEFKYEDIDEQVESGGFHRFEFAYQAEKWFGYRPKPDTHVFSCKVNFLEIPKKSGLQSDSVDSQSSSQKNILQESTSIEVSIFPSLSGMIFGTLIGSTLGTFTRNDFSFSDPFTEPARFWQNMQILFVSLIFGFIAGIVLMRRKDVQSFITIEDLWGGILIGFIVAYSGRDVFERLLNVSPTTNEILPNMNETLSSMNNTLSSINDSLAA
jgi:hypothetical protein